MKRFFLMILAVCFTSVEVAESQDKQFPTDYNICLVVGDESNRHYFHSELAASPHKRKIGMMFRADMKAFQAMLFVFHEPRQLAFWMKNVQMPLDMLFFDEQGLLTEIKSNVPPCQDNVCPSYPAKYDNNRYVLELKGGTAKKLSIMIGAKLSETDKTIQNCHDET